MRVFAAIFLLCIACAREPAAVRPTPGSGSLTPEPIEYRSSLVYHFHEDERKVRLDRP